LMYLPTEKIPVMIELMEQLLQKGGQALFSLKSTRDSRFVKQEKLAGDPWRLIQRGGGQDGLAMSFHDEERLKSLLDGFNLRSLRHLISENFITGDALGDWVAVLEK